MPMRIPLQQDLDTLQATLMEEGDLCARAIRGAMQAVRDRDPELADEVIAFDDEVDSRYLSIEVAVESLLARQTPVASDLRLVLSIIHIHHAHERISDHAVTIANLTRGEEMLKHSLDAFMNRDVEAAEALVELDELIDRANRRAVHHLMAIGSNPEMREWGLRMIIVSRCLERIGDHCVDIGEQVAYLVTGEFREFTDASTELRG